MTRPQIMVWNTFHIVRSEYLTAIICNVEIRTVRRILEAEYSRRGGKYIPESKEQISDTCPCSASCWR